MTEKQSRNKKEYSLRLRLFLSCLSVVILSIAFVTIVLRINNIGNVESHAFDDLKSTLTTQRSIVLHNIESQYRPLYEIEGILEDGSNFSDKDMLKLYSSIVEENRLCMLAYSDTEGNVTDYEGNQLGSAADRAYFYDIVNKNAEKRCEYLEHVKQSGEPRLIFSIPVYDENREIKGVLFSSKEVGVVENSLAGYNILFKSPSSIFISNKAGDIILANEEAKRSLNFTNTEKLNIFSQLQGMEAIYDENYRSGRININGAVNFAAVMPLGVNDWHLVCIVEENAAIGAYTEILENTRLLAAAITAFFIIAIGYVVILFSHIIKSKHNEMQIIQKYYDNYCTLFKEMNCTVIEFSPDNKRGGNFFTRFRGSVWHRHLETFQVSL